MVASTRPAGPLSLEAKSCPSSSLSALPYYSSSHRLARLVVQSDTVPPRSLPTRPNFSTTTATAAQQVRACGRLICSSSLLFNEGKISACCFRALCVATPIPTYPSPLQLAVLPSLQRKREEGALIKMTSRDLEERGWLRLLPQWQSLEEKMGVVLCKRPHRACLFSGFLTRVPLPGLFGLMSLLLNICVFLFFVFLLY